MSVRHCLDDKFLKREQRFRRNYALEEECYRFLVEGAQYYNASMSDLLNACLEELIQSQNITLYQSEYVLNSTRSFYISQSNIAGLDSLKQQYGLSLEKLVNIAVRNMMSKQLSSQIETVRGELETLLKHRKASDKEVISKSRQLDRLIHLYHQLPSHVKPPRQDKEGKR